MVIANGTKAKIINDGNFKPHGYGQIGVVNGTYQPISGNGYFVDTPIGRIQIHEMYLEVIKPQLSVGDKVRIKAVDSISSGWHGEVHTIEKDTSCGDYDYQLNNGLFVYENEVELVEEENVNVPETEAQEVSIEYIFVPTRDSLEIYPLSEYRFDVDPADRSLAIRSRSTDHLRAFFPHGEYQYVTINDKK